jgi:hypothetical protein
VALVLVFIDRKPGMGRTALPKPQILSDNRRLSAHSNLRMDKPDDSGNESESSLAVEDLILISSAAMPKPYADLVGLTNPSTNHAFDQVDTTSLFLLAKICKVQTQLVRDSQVEECETISCKIFLEFEKSKKTQSCKPVRQKGFSSVCRLSAAFVIPPEGIIIHWNGCPEM